MGNALGWEDYELGWGLLDVAARGGVALAFGFVIGEGFLDSTWSADWTRAQVHVVPQRHGYVLSEVERQELDEATAEEDAESPAGE
jgi:hypothetical protein